MSKADKSFEEPNHLFADLHKHLPLIKVLEAPLVLSSVFIVEDLATSRQDASKRLFDKWFNAGPSKRLRSDRQQPNSRPPV